MGISFIYPAYLWLLLLAPLTVFLGLIGRRALSPARFWGGLGLRVFVLAFIVLALAGIQLRLPAPSLTAVFVLDVSDSISPAERARGEDLIRQAVENMPAGDRSAVVLFGEDALVERLASPDSTLSRLSSTPITTRTDIAAALQLGMALFPDEGAKRLVLLSDGRENLSIAQKQAELAAMQSIELQYVALGGALGDLASQTEVLIDSLEAPADVREGQDVTLAVTIRSSAATHAALRVFSDDALIHSQDVTLQPGPNRFTVTVKDAVPGFHRYRAQVLPDADNRLQNNEASAFTVVHGPPSVLIVEGSPEEGKNLASALQAAKMKVALMTPANMPATLPELIDYDTIILVNVPAAALPAGTMDALPIYVRDLGKGLLMTGGDTAFGAGGYLRTPIETAMPVYMDVKSREMAANLALVVAVDKSGSMGRCHCDNPDLNQTYTAHETGQPKVDIAKEAIMRSAAALGDQDYLGVVAFDSQAHWTLDVKKLVGQGELEQSIGTFRAEGQTNMLSGVNAAYQALQKVDAKRKHIILMTDGWVRTGDLTPLVEKMKQEGITLSIIAAGEGSALYLQTLAAAGGGRYYPAVDMMSVPDVFLKETVQSVGQYIIEEPFQPLPNPDVNSPILRNIDQTNLPGLLGYNGTSPKGTARLDLLTNQGDPLLASWQYGLGRSAVWTSDLQGRWSSQWVQWADFSRFAAQLVGWLLPTPQMEGLDAHVSIQEQGAVIQVNAADKNGKPINDLTIQAKMISPDLITTDVTLQQVGAGQYQSVVRADDPGAYLVWLGVSESKLLPGGQMTLGMVVPYSPEYRASGVNVNLLDELARLTGGGPLAGPVQAFLHNLPAQDHAREIGRTLLLIAILLFPIDVAIRRIFVTRRDLQLAQTWLRDRMPWKAAGGTRVGEPRLLSNLFRARDRVRERNPRPSASEVEPRSQPPSPGAKTNPPSSAPPPSNINSLERLREAKKRARKE